ncbi:MAG: M15 family metallopeptidase [Parcubacteria group bacterium]
MHKNLSKIFTVSALFVLTVLIFFPKDTFATDLKKIGASCLINTECWTQNCMQSIASSVSTGKYCACKSNDSCQEYSDDPGARWSCVDMDLLMQTDTGYVSPELQALKDKSHGLNYCHSATLGDKFAINAVAPVQPQPTQKKDIIKIIAPKLSLPIPSLPVWSSYEIKPGETINIPWIADYIIALYKYAIIIASVLAVVAIMIGGVLYLTAGGLPSNIERAKGIIIGSITGLIILICSHLILTMINPELVNLKSLTIETVKEAIFDYTDESNYSQNDLSPETGVIITIPTESYNIRIKVDSSIAEVAKQSFQKLKDMGFPVNPRGTSGGRKSKGCHGLNLAIDINGKQNFCRTCGGDSGLFFNPGGPDDAKHSLTKEAVEMMKSLGWCWGGDWDKPKDYMHFSWPTCGGMKGGYSSECGAKRPYDWSKTEEENR